MKNKDPRFLPEDELKAENALLKVKLQLEHGMQHSSSEGLPPEVENQWLKNIYEYEKQYANAKRISVYSYIGSPLYRNADDLNAAEMSAEFDRLREIMNEKNVEINFICEYDASVKYRFITEELFKEEMDDMHLPGMISNFIYEEFHPNHLYDIEKYGKDIIECMFSKDRHSEYILWLLSRTVKSGNQEMSREEFADKITSFHDLYKLIEPQELRLVKIDFTDITQPASMEASVQAELTLNDSSKQSFITDIKIMFKYELDMWVAGEIEFTRRVF